MVADVSTMRAPLPGGHPVDSWWAWMPKARSVDLAFGVNWANDVRGW